MTTLQQAALGFYARVAALRSGSKPEQPKKQHPCGVLFFWRRRRDSNPRVAFDTAYALSRGASSPLEYFSMVAFIRTILFLGKAGGEDGIRTHGSYETPVFRTGSLDRSDTSPRQHLIYHKIRYDVNPKFCRQRNFCDSATASLSQRSFSGWPS